MIVWALTDDRIGGNNQSIALAEKLSKYYVVKKIEYNTLIGLPDFIRGSTLIGVSKRKSDNITDNLPSVVIFAGSTLAGVASYIKKKSKGKTFIVSITDPGINFKNFDLVLLPSYEETPDKYLSRKNVVEVNGNLIDIKKDKIKEESEKWKEFFDGYTKPIISFIVGGDTRTQKYNPKEFGIIVSNVSNIANKLSGTLLVTTTKRTSPECLMQLRQKINCDYCLYDYNWEQDPRNMKKNPNGNPYHAQISNSDFVVMTGDSMLMVSEVCYTGRSTYVYMPKNSLSKKHYRFCKALLDQYYIKEFTKNTCNLEKYRYTPLDELTRVADVICRRLSQRR